MATPTDKIENGLRRKHGSRASLELLARAPKNLDGLAAIMRASRTKRENLQVRAQGYSQRIAEAERIAKEEFKDTIPQKRDGKIREAVNAARAKILKEEGISPSTRLANEIAMNHALGQAVARRYHSPLAYLMVNTATGEAAKERRDALQLYTSAGMEELASYIADAVQRNSAPSLAAAAQRGNALSKEQRDAVMPLLRDAAEHLCGTDIRIAQAALLSLHCDALDAEIHFAEIEGREISSAARINAGVLRRDLAKVADAIADPKPENKE